MAQAISRRRLARFYVEEVQGGAKPGAVAQQIAAYLVEQRRTDDIDLLVADIATELQEQTKHVYTRVTSAKELSAHLRTAIKQLVTDKTNAKSIELHEQLDPSLLGGAIIATPEMEIDLSIRTKLNQLRI